MKTVVFALCASLLFTLPAAAVEVGGVSISDTAEAGGKSLRLNGAGIRTKFFVKVYVAGLYLENATANERDVLTKDQVRQVRMVMTRDLGRDKIVEAVEEGFEKNNASRMPALQARLDKLLSVVPALKEGQELVITYVPGTGTTLTSSAGQSVTVEGKDFADALFSVWLGAHPVDAKLKQAMLGKS